MKRHFNRLSLAGIFLATVAVFGIAVMFLWNWLAQSIFALPEINYVQAVGLLVLARILFGGLGLGGGRMAMGVGLARGHGHDNPFREKWMQMSDEERKEFIAKRHGFSDLWGGRDGFGGRDGLGGRDGSGDCNDKNDKTRGAE